MKRVTEENKSDYYPKESGPGELGHQCSYALQLPPVIGVNKKQNKTMKRCIDYDETGQSSEESSTPELR